LWNKIYGYLAFPNKVNSPTPGGPKNQGILTKPFKIKENYTQRGLLVKPFSLGEEKLANTDKKIMVSKKA